MRAPQSSGRRVLLAAIEGTHDVMAEGTGPEPYGPCQGPVRGQGGFQDVHPGVDLPVHLPVAHLADEHLAHPISAPSATHWAGLTGPLRVDFDDRHAREGGLVFDLTVDLATGPGGETTIRSPRAAARAVEGEVLEDDCGSTRRRGPHEPLGYSMESLPNSVPFPATFSIEEDSLDASVVGLLPRESPPSSEVSLLDTPHTVERHTEKPRRIARYVDPVEGILVRVQGDRAPRLIGLRASLRRTTMIFPGTTMRDPSPHDESPRIERCHSESGRWSCTPSVPRIGMRSRPVSRSSR